MQHWRFIVRYDKIGVGRGDIMNGKTETIAQMSFHFEGLEDHQIDVSVLTETLSAINNLMLETQNTCMSGTECNLKVTANRAGSFVTDLQVFAATAVTMFTPENVSYASDMVSLILDFFDIKKFIKSKFPKLLEKQKDKIIITNSENETHEYPIACKGFFENAKIENAVVQVIQNAERETQVTGISIEGNNKKMQKIQIPRMMFDKMSNPVIVDDSQKNVQEIVSDDTIFVRQADFMGNQKWQFQKDKRFSAKILDDEWIKDFKLLKYPIYPGVQFRVRLKTILTLSDDGLPVDGSAEYEIEKVLKVIYPEPSEQIGL